jgi:hypothetical protein
MVFLLTKLLSVYATPDAVSPLHHAVARVQRHGTAGLEDAMRIS